GPRRCPALRPCQGASSRQITTAVFASFLFSGDSSSANASGAMTGIGYLLLVVLLLAVSTANGQNTVPGPAYPRVNLATAYEVDPNWPRRPLDVYWGAVPGIAVDAQDNVWIFTRTNPTVQVYAPDGRYLFGWRDARPRAGAP